ncbi:methyl-accepting chemotaxis protein, partial [Shewanella algidipiscicola]|uniref:methyl-accepting chemotaxis protein n=1 Tax=Shewanella algidipiscicola TaxID=614070 RepID=UPI00217FA634
TQQHQYHCKQLDFSGKTKRCAVELMARFILIQTLINRFCSLNQEVGNFAGVVQEIEHDSVAINEVLDVISNIAEQTNLLALN